MKVQSVVLVILLGAAVLAQTDLGVKYTTVNDAYFVATFINRDQPDTEKAGVNSLQVSEPKFFSVVEIEEEQLQERLQKIGGQKLAEHITAGIVNWNDRFFRLMQLTTISANSAVNSICSYRRSEDETPLFFIYCSVVEATFDELAELSEDQDNAIRDSLYVRHRSAVLAGLPEEFKSARAPPKKAPVVTF